MLQLLRSKFGPDLPVGARQDTVKDPASLEGIQLFEALVSETLGCVLKDVDDMRRFRAEVAKTGLSPFLPTAS